MILVIDNRDSFVETLARYVREQGAPTRVIRNDKINITELKREPPTAIVLSPGPGRPSDAGVTLEVICAFARIPIFGVCLGHQAMVEVYGGETIVAPEQVHGRASEIFHDGDELFHSVPSPFSAGRYHSLLAMPASRGTEINATAWLDDGTPMAIRHRAHPHFGVQFHPESLLTPHGATIVRNFIEIAGGCQ